MLYFSNNKKAAIETHWNTKQVKTACFTVEGTFRNQRVLDETSDLLGEQRGFSDLYLWNVNKQSFPGGLSDCLIPCSGMIGEQGQLEGSLWLSAVYGRRLSQASDAIRWTEIHSERVFFFFLNQSCPNGMTALTYRLTSRHADRIKRNKTKNNGAWRAITIRGQNRADI